MKTTLGFLILFITFSSSLFSQNIIKRSIYFDSDKSNIRTSELQTLQTVIDSFSKVKDYAFQLSGNTDADGSDTYNIALSDKRVGAIKAFLLSKGIAESKIQAVAQGENKPIADNQTEKGKQSNRRVDIELVSINPLSHKLETPMTSVSEQKFPFEKGKNYSIKRLYQEFKTDAQKFNIVAGKETVIVGKKGTIIKIAAHSFDVTEGTTVEVSLKEFYNTQDIIKEDLTTLSKGKILETNGMIHIEATANQQPVKVKEDYLLMMPKNQIRDDEKNDMQLFTGVTTIQKANIDWEVLKQPNFSFLFKASDIAIKEKFDTLTQRQQLENLKKSLIDTCSCKTMFVWKLDSIYAKRMKKEGKNIAHLEEFVKSDTRPRGYDFYYVNKDTMSKLCRDIAAWAAPDFSWHRRIPWKHKHQVSNSSLYAQYRASSYDSLLINVDRHIYLAEESEKALKASGLKGAKQFNVYETRQLNWINCDRFSNYSEELLTNIKTKIKAQPNVDAKIVFTKNASILGTTIINGNLGFHRIPKGESATIIAMKLENGISYMAMQEIVIGSTILKLEFKPLTPTDIDNSLAAK
jgi:OmpA family